MSLSQEIGLGSEQRTASAALRTWVCSALLLVVLPAAAGAALPEWASAAPVTEADGANLDFSFSPPRFTVGFVGGWVWNRSDSELHDFLLDQFTLERSDFNAPAMFLDIAWRVIWWLDVVGGVGISDQTTKSEYRDWVDSETGDAIQQTTRTTQVPLTLSVRFYPLARERRVGKYAYLPRRFVPYAGGGIGGTWYELKQKGEFVDFVDDAIFQDAFRTEGWAFSGHVFLGGELLVAHGVSVALEGRYQWASAHVGDSFVGFDPIDLDGALLLVGIHWRR